jgi:hypothetical protein
MVFFSCSKDVSKSYRSGTEEGLIFCLGSRTGGKSRSREVVLEKTQEIFLGDKGRFS